MSGRMGSSAARRAAFVVATLCVLAAAPSASWGGGEDGPSSDALLCDFRPYWTSGQWITSPLGPRWSEWWFADRTALLKPTYRAARGSDGATPIDAAARAKARERLRIALKSNDPLVASEAALALGRLGDVRDIEALAAIVRDVGGRKVALERRLHRLAAIGLGLLPLGDPGQAADARDALLDGIRSAAGHTDDFMFFWANCAFALSLRGDAAAVPPLVVVRHEGLAETCIALGRERRMIHPEVHGAIAYALACLAGEEALPEIEEHLRGVGAPAKGNSDTSWMATHALTRIPGAAAKRLLRKAAKDERVLVRRGAMQCLGSSPDPNDDETAALLVAAMKEDKDALCRQMAAVSLGRSGHASASKALLAEFESARALDRPYVALALGLCARANPDPKIEAVLVRALAEASSDEDRGSFVLACGLAGAAAARREADELLTRRRGGVGPVAPQACFALGLLGPDADDRKLLHESVAQTEDGLRRREAALALALAKDATVVAELRAIAASKRAGDVDRATAVVSLGRVGSDADVPFVMELIDDPDTSDPLRACVVHALGWLLDRREFATLGVLAADAKWWKLPIYDTIYDVQHLVD